MSQFIEVESIAGKLIYTVSYVSVLYELGQVPLNEPSDHIIPLSQETPPVSVNEVQLVGQEVENSVPGESTTISLEPFVNPLR